jgi:hypothetical protein
VEQAGALSLISGQWKYIEPNPGPRIERSTNTELGNDPNPQLYDLSLDIGEKTNVADRHPKKVQDMAGALQRIRERSRSRP